MLCRRRRKVVALFLADSRQTEYNTLMAKNVIRRIVILFLLFVGCVAAFSIQENKQGRTHAASFTGPLLPVVCVQVEGMKVNPMTAYRQEMKESMERECLTPLSVDRSVTLLIDTNGNAVHDISYQVTSLEDEEILENGELTEYTEENGTLKVPFALTTSEIRNGQEYMMRVTLHVGDGSTLYYYSRLVQYGAGNIREYLAFTNEFIQDATNKVTASDLGVYMEPDLAEANWSLAHITITSSTDLLSWGGLNPEIIKTTPPTIMEINDINADIRQKYVIRARDENLNEEYYTVEEYFRVTEYNGALIVRNYQRDCGQIFDGTLPVIGESALNLGIQLRDVNFVQNQGSTRAAFVANGDIWTYDAMADKLTSIFSFRGKTLEGEKEVPDLEQRTEFVRHGIYLKGINDNGDVTFVVYGYMPTGAHEGLNGVSVYQYSGEKNRTDEVFFLPLNMSTNLLERYVSRLSYVGTANVMYLHLGKQLCRIDLADGSYTVVQDGIEEKALFVSGSQKQVAWVDSEDGTLGSTLTVMNLETEVRREIVAPEGQRITGCGFIGEDIAYGLTREENIYQQEDGSILQGMYLIRIEGEDGSVRKEYARDGVYVTAVTPDENSIQLSLATQSDKGLGASGTDQIRNNELKEERIQAVPISNTRTEEQMWLTFSDILLRTDPDVSTASLGSVREGVETILELPETDEQQYYIYSYGKLQDIESARNVAIQKAYEVSGTVLDDRQRCIWQRYNWPTVYRIDLNSLTPELLAAGSSGSLQAFEAALPADKKLFDMTGVVTTGLFYPISRGCPVFVQLIDGTSYLLIGYTESDILYWDAANGTTAEMERKKADAIFRRGKYRFYTWENREKEESEAETAPDETATEEVPAETVSEEAPAETVPEETPAETVPEETPAQAAPGEGAAEETPAAEAPAQETGEEESPAALQPESVAAE